MENLNTENKYMRAKKRVDELKKFYSNLTSYVVVITMLAIINYWTNEWRYAWFLWAAFGWGIGLAFHAAKAFQWNPVFNEGWEERKIKEFMEEEEKGTTETNKRWE